MNMREIKFRVWIPYNKIMMVPKSIQTIHESILSGVTVGEMKQWVYLQWTGLTDKNGKEIYEGDIVRWSNWANGSVNSNEENRKNSEVKWSCRTGHWFVESDLWAMGLLTDIKVIGNIYEQIKEGVS